MKQLRVGQKVKLSDPVRTVARFYDANARGVIGAGGIIIDSQLLHGDAWVMCLGERCNKTRGLIVFGDPQSNNGMWLDAPCLERSK